MELEEPRNSSESNKRIKVEEAMLFQPMLLLLDDDSSDNNKKENNDDDDNIEPSFAFNPELVFTLGDVHWLSTALRQASAVQEPVHCNPDIVEASLFTTFNDDGEAKRTRVYWSIPSPEHMLDSETETDPTQLLHHDEAILGDLPPQQQVLPVRQIEAKALLQDLQLEAPPPQPPQQPQQELLDRIAAKLQINEEEEDDPAAIRARVRRIGHTSSTELASLVKLHLFLVCKSLVATPQVGRTYLDFCESNLEYRSALPQHDEVFSLLSQLFDGVEDVAAPEQRTLIPTRILVDADQVCSNVEVRRVVAALQSDFQVACVERTLVTEQQPVTFAVDASTAILLMPLPFTNPVECTKWTSQTCKWLVFTAEQYYSKLYIMVLLGNAKPDPASRTAIRNLTSTLAVLNRQNTLIRLAASPVEAAAQIRACVDETALGKQADWYRERDGFADCVDADMQAQISFLCKFPGVTPLRAEELLLRQSIASYVKTVEDNEQFRLITHAFLTPAIIPATNDDEEHEEEEEEADGRRVNTLRYERDVNGSSQTRLVWRPKN